jgi:hypothetical protein
MTPESARPNHAEVTLYSPNSSVLGEDLLIPDEASPLLKPQHAHEHQPTISGPRRSSLSSFFDDNTGLLLVAASQLFASAMSLLVKVLNSLDEPVPTLEV